MKKTAEEIAQWVIDNRYAKSENNKIDDRELYDTLVNEIKSYRSQASELPSDEKINKQAKVSCKGNSHAIRYQHMLHQFREGAKWMRSIALTSRDARIKELEEEVEELKSYIRTIQELTPKP